MAKNIIFFACLLIMAMDIVAGVLGIQAEIAQNKVKYLRMSVYECRDPSYQAFNLGLAAVILLSMAQVIAILLGGCIFITSRQELYQASSNRQLAAASNILSWIMWVIAFSLLISGTLANSKSQKNCRMDNGRLLSIGGIMCFMHGLFAVAYYVSAAAVVQEENWFHQLAQEASPAVVQEENMFHELAQEASPACLCRRSF